jgi:transcriptional regulator with XRE-family HTH domain
MIGVMIRKTRLETHMTLKALASSAGITTRRLDAYELGEKPIPLPELEVLVSALNISLREYQDKNSPVGEWFNNQRAVRDFMQLPPELQIFVCKPVNRPYLELAQRLSEMSVEKLRNVAEGLLEITL